MISARGVVKEFGGRPVLAGVDLEMMRGESVALFGPNGAGKSTLVRALAGLVPVDAGQILLEGVDVRQAPPQLRRRLGVLGHRSFLYDNLSAEENLLFWARVFGVRDARPRIDALLKRVGLWVFASDPVRTYSRGMVQRLALARVMLHDPDLYLLDEPFTGLDRAGAQLLTCLLMELQARGRTMLIVSHRPEEVAPLCQRFVVMARGRLEAEVRQPAAGLDERGSFVQSLDALVDRVLAERAEVRP